MVLSVLPFLRFPRDSPLMTFMIGNDDMHVCCGTTNHALCERDLVQRYIALRGEDLVVVVII